MNKPSQAFLDSEIGIAVNDAFVATYHAGRNVQPFPEQWSWLATIERLLAAERRKVAEECVSLFADHEHCCNWATIASRIRARFPAPKEDV